MPCSVYLSVPCSVYRLLCLATSKQAATGKDRQWIRFTVSSNGNFPCAFPGQLQMRLHQVPRPVTPLATAAARQPDFLAELPKIAIQMQANSSALPAPGLLGLPQATLARLLGKLAAALADGTSWQSCWAWSGDRPSPAYVGPAEWQAQLEAHCQLHELQLQQGDSGCHMQGFLLLALSLHNGKTALQCCRQALTRRPGTLRAEASLHSVLTGGRRPCLLNSRPCRIAGTAYAVLSKLWPAWQTCVPCTYLLHPPGLHDGSNSLANVV